MKHKHYDMIVAKAANMDLVIFRKDYQNTPWRRLVDSELPTDEGKEYFLCLPRHKDACLHWLNGGEIQVLDDNTWEDCGPHQGLSQNWSVGVFLMGNSDYRIKPRKEKRWIVVFTDDETTCGILYKTKQDAQKSFPLAGDECFIEIEVDV